MRIVVAAVLSLFVLSSCGGGGGGDDSPPVDNGPTQNDPSAPLEDSDVPETAEEITESATSTIGLAIDESLDSQGAVTGSSGILEQVMPDISDVWNEDARQLVSTSLALGGGGSSTQTDTELLVDPDEQAICAELSMGGDDSQVERERCESLYGGVTVSVNAPTNDSGIVTYFFNDDPVLLINYAGDSSVIEVNLSGLRGFRDAEAALDPTSQSDGPYDEYDGVVRLSTSTTNAGTDSAQGEVSIEVVEPISIVSSDQSTSLSVAAGRLFDMSVDESDGSGRIALGVGRVQATERLDDGVMGGYDLDGLTATIDVQDNADLLVVEDVSVGQGPFRVVVDDAEVMSVGLDAFGFTARENVGEIVLDGAFSADVFLDESLGVGSSLNKMQDALGFDVSAAFRAESGTEFVAGADYQDGNAIRINGGSFGATYSDGADDVFAQAGDCFVRTDDVGDWGIRAVSCSGADFDADGDATDDNVDNCPAVPNGDQADGDGDGRGDACDICPAISDASQADADGDGIGDACDPDVDGDTVPNASDNCPVTPNTDQANLDGDVLGDACDTSDDTDTDTDGVLDAVDNCPTDSNADQSDVDGDSLGDACDPVNDTDTDGDGTPDDMDNCPMDSNGDQSDGDMDGIGDACDTTDDTDTDGDGTPDDMDNCPMDSNGDQSDGDMDGMGDACDTTDDTDTDGDGTPDNMDNCPMDSNGDQSDGDMDGMGDACDTTDDTDTDGDGTPDTMDNCPADSNSNQSNLDNDAFGDVCDDDRDGDNVPNGADNCPSMSNGDQQDLDNDGIGFVCDTVVPFGLRLNQRDAFSCTGGSNDLVAVQFSSQFLLRDLISGDQLVEPFRNSTATVQALSLQGAVLGQASVPVVIEPIMGVSPPVTGAVITFSMPLSPPLPESPTRSETSMRLALSVDGTAIHLPNDNSEVNFTFRGCR